MNSVAHSLNSVKAAVPRVISLHARDGATVAIFCSPSGDHIARMLVQWEAAMSQGATVIEWIDGEPTRTIADTGAPR